MDRERWSGVRESHRDAPGLRGLERIDSNEQNMTLARFLNQQAASEAAGLIGALSSRVMPSSLIESTATSLSNASAAFANPMTPSQANDLIDKVEAEMAPIKSKCGEVQGWVEENVPR